MSPNKTSFILSFSGHLLGLVSLWRNRVENSQKMENVVRDNAVGRPSLVAASHRFYKENKQQRAGFVVSWCSIKTICACLMSPTRRHSA